MQPQVQNRPLEVTQSSFEQVALTSLTPGERAVAQLKDVLKKRGIDMPAGLEEAYSLDESPKAIAELKLAKKAVEAATTSDATPNGLKEASRERLQVDTSSASLELSQATMTRPPNFQHEVSLAPPSNSPTPSGEPSGNAPPPPQAQQAPPPGGASSLAQAAKRDGKSKMVSGDITGAIAQFERAVELEPLNPEHYDALADARAKAA